MVRRGVLLRWDLPILRLAAVGGLSDEVADMLENDARGWKQVRNCLVQKARTEQPGMSQHEWQKDENENTLPRGHGDLNIRTTSSGQIVVSAPHAGLASTVN